MSAAYKVRRVQDHLALFLGALTSRSDTGGRQDDSEEHVLEMGGAKRDKDRPRSVGGRFPLAARERNLSERRVRFGSPRRVARQDAHELLGVSRGSFGQREQLLVGALGAERRRLQGEPGERLAPGRGPTLLRCEANRSPEVLPHALGVSGSGADHSACRLELACPKRSRVDGRRLGGTIEPPLCLLDLTELQMRQREPVGRGELE